MSQTVDTEAGAQTKSYLRRYDDFDEQFLEERTGIKGWGTRFTAVTVLSRDEAGVNLLYAPLMSFIQSKFEADNAYEEKPGFNFRYLARGLYPPQKQKQKKNTFESFYEIEKLSPEERAAKEAAEREQQKKVGIYQSNRVVPGLGVFKMKWNGEDIYLLHQHHEGLTNSVVIFIAGRGRRSVIQNMLDEMMSVYNAAKKQPKLPQHFQIYKYKPGYGWQANRKGMARSLESVVLPQKTKDEIMEDLDDFLNEENKQWFMERGIPCKYGYRHQIFIVLKMSDIGVFYR